MPVLVEGINDDFREESGMLERDSSRLQVAETSRPQFWLVTARVCPSLWLWGFRGGGGWAITMIAGSQTSRKG